MKNLLKKHLLTAVVGSLASPCLFAITPTNELEYRDQSGFNDAAVDSQSNVFIARSAEYLTKFNANGVQLWQRHNPLSASWFGGGSRITVDSLGNAYSVVTSSYEYGRVTKFDSEGNTTLLNPGGGISYFWDHGINLKTDSADNLYVFGTGYLEKYDVNGNKLWQSGFSNKWGAPTRDIEFDAQGNVYVLGKRDASSWHNIVLSKYSPSGQLLWMKSFPITGFGDAIGLEIDSSGALVVAAGRYGPNGYWISTLIKYSDSGNLITSNDLDLGSYSRANAFELDAQDNAFLTGAFGDDLFVAKLDTNLTQQWVQTRDYNWSDAGYDLEVDDKGNVYVSGNASTGYHRSNTAFITLKFNSLGDEQWVSRNDGGIASWIKLQGGKVYTAGQTIYPHSSLMIRFNDMSNTAPVADAGLYPAEECSGALTSVTLDGTGSSDADGDPLSYTWSGSFGSLNGAVVSTHFALGVHPVTLTVDDGNGGSNSQSVNVHVVDTTAPSVDAGADQIVIANSAQGTPYSINYSAADSCGGVATTVSPQQALYPVGSHTLTVTAEDDNGNQASDTMTLTVAYAFGGFKVPLKADAVYKLGRTLPIKFQLFYADGSLVTDAAPTLMLQQLNNNEPVGEPIDPQTNAQSATDNGFRYSDDQYIYNLDTSYLNKGNYRLLVDLGDGNGFKSIDIGFK